jgi:hypothetical protein
MARAAKEFAAADAYQPSAQALQAALDAAIDADDVALGTELLERAKREAPPAALASSITAATLKFNARAGKLKILCPRGAMCSATIDGNPVSVDRVIWAPVGPRTVAVQVEGSKPSPKSVDVSAESSVEIFVGKELVPKPATLDPEPTAAPSGGTSSSTREGVSPVVFYAAAGVTVAFAGFATVMMIRTSSKHGDFDDQGCGHTTSAQCSTLSDDGKSAQSAANVGLVLTAIGLIATAAIGIGFVNWKGDRASGDANPLVLTF